MHAQPAFASVTSESPSESADDVSPEEPSRADDWRSSSLCVGLADDIALAPQADPQAPITSPPIATNTAPVRRNTFGMLDLHGKLNCILADCAEPEPTTHSGSPETNKETRGGSYRRRGGRHKMAAANRAAMPNC